MRTYAEILFDWFATLEQSSLEWDEADGADLVAYRNRMDLLAAIHTYDPKRSFEMVARAQSGPL